MKKHLTFVYPCRPGENEELRYSIRSVVAQFPDAEVWVVGHAPGWYTGNYINTVQDKNVYSNAYLNLQTAALSEDIPEEIVIMNDDFYIIDDIDSIPVFYEGTLENKAMQYFDNNQVSYARKISNTNNKLVKMGFDMPLSYELHVPFPVEKSKLLGVLKSNTTLWRSLYGNIFNLGGTMMQDVKVYNSKKMSFKNYDYKNIKSPFISSQDDSFVLIYNDILKDMFPLPSKYEID